jgi:hypothetical protein
MADHQAIGSVALVIGGVDNHSATGSAAAGDPIPKLFNSAKYFFTRVVADVYTGTVNIMTLDRERIYCCTTSRCSLYCCGLVVIFPLASEQVLRHLYPFLWPFCLYKICRFIASATLPEETLAYD